MINNMLKYLFCYDPKTFVFIMFGLNQLNRLYIVYVFDIRLLLLLFV